MRERMEQKEGFEPVEILPANIGALPSSEAAPLLSRAASRIDIVRPKNVFWNGMKENLKGASAWIDAKKAEIGSKTLRAIAGASLVATMVSACARPVETAYTPSETAPRVTETIPTDTPEPSPTPTETPTSEVTPTPVYESLWDHERIRWGKEITGSYQGVNTTLSLEIDYSIYERPKSTLVGFEEAAGTWQDVGNTTAAFVSLLPQTEDGKRKVEINMDFHEDGTWDYVKFDPRQRSQNTRVEFDPDVPIRFIYFNGDGGREGRVFPLHNPYFSRGWGVDPETQGLVIFIGAPSITREDEDAFRLRGWIYGSYIMGNLIEIVGAQFGNDILNQQKLDTLNLLWGNKGSPIVGIFHH